MTGTGRRHVVSKSESALRAFLLALLAACLLACPEPEEALPEPPSGGGTEAVSPLPWFEDQASERGLRFTFHSGHDGKHYMPEIMAGGGALFDADGDGDLDAYLVQGGRLVGETVHGNALYLNDGNGHFQDKSAGSGADDEGYGMGVACGDYDGDGDTDLYVTNVGPNVLLRNDGEGRFVDVSAASGADHEGWASSAAFVDYDADGRLDLFFTNYLEWSPEAEPDCDGEGGFSYCHPQSYDAPAADVLLRNEGGGRFRDVSAELGLAELRGTGLGVLAGDFTGDGLVDLFVANDGMPDVLWTQFEDGSFVNMGLVRGCAVDEEGLPKAGMGVASEDLNGDGFPELLVTNLERETDSFFWNQGGLFADGTSGLGLAGLSSHLTRFGVGWADFDNDGRLDIYEVAGRVSRASARRTADPYAEPSLLLRYRSDGRYEEVLPEGGTAESLILTSRGLAFGDVDGDGGVDLLIVNKDAPANLLLNVHPTRGSWISFQVLDESGADALGARVSLSRGAERPSREVRAAYSYQVSNDPRLHFGLGEHEVVTDVRVRFSDGTEERFGDFDAGQVVTLVRGAGQSAE